MMHEWPGEAGNQSRDSASCEALFKRAREAGRILVTRSKKLIKRRTCPQYIFVTESNHEKAFQQIAKLMQLRFESEKIFRRCTKCNGQFETVSPDRLKTIEGLPEGLRDGVDKATGKAQILHLFRRVVQANILVGKQIQERRGRLQAHAARDAARAGRRHKGSAAGGR